MAQDWTIDVLADLRQYAIRNYHMRLAEQLDDAIVVAAAELRAADSAREADSRRGFGLTTGPFAPVAVFSRPGEEKISRPV